MNKTTHISIYSILIMIIFFAMAVLAESCGKKDTSSPSLEEAGDRLEQVTDQLSSEEYFEDGDVDYADDYDNEGSSTEAQKNNDVEATVDYTTTRSNTPSTPSTSTTNNRKSYMIVAGNYLVESNADAMVQKLKSSGYSSAEKVIFDLSQYYTVIAARYDTKSSADDTSQRLKNGGFDNYVLGSK